MDITKRIPPKPDGDYVERQMLHYRETQPITVYVTEKETLFPEGSLIVSRTNCDGIITHANEAFIVMSGWTREELIGAPHWVLRHPDMPSAPFADLWDTVQQGKRWMGYVKNIRKDGGFYWVYATVIPNMRKGKIIGYSSIRRKPARNRIEEMSILYADMLKAEQEQGASHV